MQSKIFLTDAEDLLIKAGSYEFKGQAFTVAEDIRFPVSPAPVVWVENEPLKLSPEVPQSFNVGTRLAGPDAWDINALDALIPSTLTLRRSPGGEILEEGNDFLLSARHALLGIGPESCVIPADTVFATYTYALMRLDSVFVDIEGNVGYAPGIPHITTPQPPPIPENSVRLANIFRPYRATVLEPDHIFPILESGESVLTGTMAGRIPNTLRKLKNGNRVVIVCWGDSVTAGGNASEPRYRYTDVFGDGLRRMFPQAQIEVHNVSVGGSSSVSWLYPEQYPFARPELQDALDFNRVTAPKPDLVTLEFVNDAGLEESTRNAAYECIRQHLANIGAEWILITPHFTHPLWMGLSMRGQENRPYVSFLKDYAANHHLALADASERWEHLWKEGIPYLTLLHNSVNHPDNRGHRIFAEELWKCFEGS
jgi:lysophospholipase L1-like esterase